MNAVLIVCPGWLVGLDDRLDRIVPAPHERLGQAIRIAAGWTPLATADHRIRAQQAAELMAAQHLRAQSPATGEGVGTLVLQPKHEAFHRRGDRWHVAHFEGEPVEFGDQLANDPVARQKITNQAFLPRTP